MPAFAYCLQALHCHRTASAGCVHQQVAAAQGEVRSPGGGAESECGTGRVLQDRLNQLHEGLASKEKHRKVIVMLL